MFQYLQGSNPAVRAHLDAQFSLFKDMSQKVFDAAQKMNELNLQVSQSMMEESIQGVQQVMSAQSPYDAISAAVSQVQPAADQLRTYQHHATNIAANTQIELAKTTEARVPEASRTAATVAEEVARRATEESERVSQRQRETAERMAGRTAKPTPPSAQGARPNA